MKHKNQLLEDYLEGELAPGQEQLLADWLAADRENVRQFVRETHLHRQLRQAMLARAYEAEALASAAPTPVKTTQELVYRPADALARVFAFMWSPALRAGWLAAAVCLALAGSIWWLTPVMGAPAVAQINGPGVTLERADQAILVKPGTRLQAGDVLRTAANASVLVTFGPEMTKLALGPGGDVLLTSLARGKTFSVRFGKVEATVARQRPFRPMVIDTPQAEARVLGTRFKLVVTNSATRLDVIEGKVRFTRTRDLKTVRVAGSHYAVAAADYELAALPMTGGILREFWSGAVGNTFNDLQKDPRFPGHPDRWDVAPSFELQPVQTNRLAVRFRGYLHPPVTGNYEFWLAGATDAYLLMSPTERDVDGRRIALSTGPERTWDGPRFKGNSQWAPPIPLVAGRRYYVEAMLLVRRDEGHLSVGWKGPGRPRELLTGEFLSPAGPKH